MGSRKRNKATELKELNKNRVFAKLNNCPTSPRKMRLVADQVRGKKVDRALSILKFIFDFTYCTLGITHSTSIW